MKHEDAESEQRPRRGFAVLFSAVALLSLSASYGLSVDALYAITIWPAWVWLGVGVSSASVAWRASRKRAYWLLIGWLAFAAVFAEEPLSVLRSLWIMPGSESGASRVVSLNCAGGDVLAMREALARSPDLLLLQESPSERELREAVGSDCEVLVGPDASIVARGRLEPLPLPKWTTNFVAARWWKVGATVPVYVVSLRLQPPVFRFDYWNPGCWSAYADGKRRRRMELDAIVAYLDDLPMDGPAIVGGDFNTPPDCSIEARLRTGFTDAFSQSGAGWGATAVNDYPLVRIDRIWFRGGMSTSARAINTKHSDHRMVETELVIP